MGFKSRWISINTSLLLILIISIAFSTALGPVKIPVGDVFRIIFKRVIIFNYFIDGNVNNSWNIIIWDIRLPQILLGVLVGIALASAGTAMQGLFKNPMADPFIIGVSSGAAIGAVFGIILQGNVIGFDIIYLPQIFSFTGAFLAVLLVYTIARSGGKVSITNLLLAGIAVNFFFSALTSLLLFVYVKDLHSVLFWLIGSLGGSKWSDVKITTPIVIFGFTVLMIYSKNLNLMLLGEESAKNLGVNVERTKKIVLFSATLITAAVVTVSGIIGFIGLIVPHIMRLIVGPDHRILLPSSALAGGIFLIWCDTIARTEVLGAYIPVALLTSLLGGPFFIYLLWRRKAQGVVF